MTIPFLGEIFKFLRDYMNANLQAKLAETQSKVVIAEKRAEAAAKIEVAEATAEINWDLVHAEGSKDSWKDEFWTILLAIPIVMCFTPWFQDDVAAGFVVLEESVPDWYIVAVGTAIGAAFGYRKIVTYMSKGRIK